MRIMHFLNIRRGPSARVRAGWLVGLFVLAAALGFTAVQTGSPRHARPRPGGTLRVKPYPNELSLRLDPIVPGPYFLYEQLYDNLVRLDHNLNVVPALAEYWVISEDGRRYTFQLRQGVRFHNGAELSAEDVKFSLERLLTAGADASFRTYFQSRVVGAEDFYRGRAGDVAGFVVRDKTTFEIHWLKPYISGLYLLSMTFCKILPRDAVLAEGRDFFLKPAGTGPFRFGYWLRDPRLNIVGVRLERYRDYYGRTAYPDALEYSPHYTEDQFRARDVHIIPSESDRLTRPPYQVVEDGPFDTSFLAFSCRIPPLDDPRVRRALSLAVDEARLAEAATGSFNVPLVTHNIIPVKIPGFFPLEDREGCDPARAKALLEEAGVDVARDLPALTVIEIENPRTDRLRIYRELKAQIEALGIRVERSSVADWASIQRLETPYVLLFDWDMDFPDPENVIQPLFESQAVVNQWLLGYINPTVDTLLAKAMVEPSWAKRSELFREIERILLEDRPVLPLYSVRHRLSVQPEVRGLKLPPLGYYFLNAKDVWFERGT